MSKKKTTYFEIYELTQEVPILRHVLVGNHMVKRNLLNPILPTAFKVLKVGQKNNWNKTSSLICVPWSSHEYPSAEGIIFGSHLRLDFSCLRFVDIVKEEEVGRNESSLISNPAKAQKLKRLLKQGPVSVEIVYHYGGSSKIFLEQGSGVVKKHSGEYTVQGSYDYRGVRNGIRLSNLVYDSIQLMTPEEALTCDNDDIRLLSANQGKAFAEKIKKTFMIQFENAFRGYARMIDLVNAVVNGKRVVPGEVERISRTAAKEAREKIQEVAKRHKLEELFGKFDNALKEFKKDAIEEVGNLFDKGE